MEYKIRELKLEEAKVLDTFLYEAIYIPQGVASPSKEIINKPELQIYVEEFGSKNGDLCFVAEVDSLIVGAVWVRIMNDYGHIDDETPSFAISLLKDYRNYGIGTALMKKMLEELRNKGYKKASLAVQKVNYAVGMYKKVGFEIIDENEEEYIMICQL
ncbi:MAG: GNAT family N-acetyltransferase [Saccharofermentanaceae bacterium]|jgi:ribosomal protein S18 acetylase RimI-like enzyme|nr:GNAT family N-acetyltransferase [Clostridiaceae bacterium]HPG63956.1 GNAT family N-acetyltransferase [Saccharofermentans sp.]HUM23675.1 GNAT family N-acetyltransferase [Saccharofermentans sp.]